MRRRLRHWTWRLTKASAALLGIVVAALLFVVYNLDRPWIKHRIQALVLGKAGVALDYKVADVNLLSGANLDDVVVLSPPEIRAIAPELLRIGHLAVGWSRDSLTGDGAPIEVVDLRDVSITVVIDENGRTSFDLLSPSTSPPTPLSKKLESLIGSPLPLVALGVHPVTLTLIETDHGVETARTVVKGIELSATAASAAGNTLSVDLGTSEHPLDLDIERGGQSAHGTASVMLRASPRELALAVDARVDRQTFADGVHVTDMLHAHARARFDPDQGTTAIELTAKAADGAADGIDLGVSLSDGGDIVVRRASGDLDLARVLAEVPAGLVPVSLARGRVRFRVAGAVIAPNLQMETGGVAVVDGDLADVRVRLGPDRSARVGSLALALRALPDQAGGNVLHGTVAATDVVADETRADDVRLVVDGRQSSAGTLEGTSDLKVATLKTSGHATMQDLDAATEVKDLAVDTAHPLATRGDITVSVTAAGADNPSLRADGLSLRAHTALSGAAPFSADVHAALERLRVSSKGREVIDVPVRVEASASDVPATLDDGKVHVAATAGNLEAIVDAKKQADTVGFDVSADAPNLALARPMVPPSVATLVPLERMPVKLDWHGRVDALSSAPLIHHHGKLELEKPAFGTMTASALDVTFASNGTAMVHDADVDVRAIALEILGGDASDEHLTFKAKVDRPARSLAVALTTDGRATTNLTARASFDRGRHAIVYDMKGEASHLGPLRPLLLAMGAADGVDLSQLAVRVSGSGVLYGVVTDVDADGRPRLAPAPTVTAAVEGPLDVHVDHFTFGKGLTALAVPSFGWHADFKLAGNHRVLEGRLDVPTVRFSQDAHVVDLSGFSDRLAAEVTGDLRNPDADVVEHVSLHGVTQDIIPIHLGDVSLDVSAARDHAGIVRLRQLKLADVAGGTAMDVSGTLVINETRRTLALHGKLEQDLGRLSADPSRFAGRGKLTIDARADTADFSVYQTRSDVRFDGVDVRLPKQDIAVEGANGVIPIKLDVRIAKGVVSLLRDVESSPYSMLRFADQQPLLSQSSFLTVRSISTPWVAIAPLAGNLQIDRTIVAMPQFEMGVRKGTVTGQWALDFQGASSIVALHLRATQVLSSHGEPFDGNTAVVVSLGSRSVEGRAEILKIGKQHLLDLLDLHDPLHQDPAVNRVRTALALGYPDHVRIDFDHGFASAHIELGGLGSLLSIGELRGIPMGPLIDRMLRHR